MNVAEVAAGAPLDELGEHPVRRRRVVLEARARLPVAAPAREPRQPALAVVPVERRRTARAGKPDVCSITCSTVIDVLAVRRELGDELGDTDASTSSAPSPIRIHTAPATTAFVAEKIT